MSKDVERKAGGIRKELLKGRGRDVEISVGDVVKGRGRKAERKGADEGMGNNTEREGSGKGEREKLTD